MKRNLLSNVLAFTPTQGKETADPETGKQCPFFDELQAVFTERAINMQRQLLETEAGASQSKKKLKRLSGDRSSEELSDDEDDEDEDSDEERPTKSKKKKVEKQQQRASDKSKTGNTINIHNLLQEFFQQQQRIEFQLMEMMERRARERHKFEQEWRQSMENLERERLILDQAWREREEQRRMREESRAERRDVLLNKLIQDDL